MNYMNIKILYYFNLMFTNNNRVNEIAYTINNNSHRHHNSENSNDLGILNFKEEESYMDQI